MVGDRLHSRQLQFKLTEAVGLRRRGWQYGLGRLGSPPQAVGDATVSPPGGLLSRGRGEGDGGRSGDGTRRYEESPDEQAG